MSKSPSLISVHLYPSVVSPPLHLCAVALIRVSRHFFAPLRPSFALICARARIIGPGQVSNRPSARPLPKSAPHVTVQPRMNYAGKIRNDVVVLPARVRLPDGAEAEVKVADTDGNLTFADRYKQFIDMANDLPPDMAANLDKYVARSFQEMKPSSLTCSSFRSLASIALTSFTRERCILPGSRNSQKKSLSA